MKSRIRISNFRTPNKCSSRQRGFTLIETLAAMVIFALTFSVLLDLNSNALKQARRSDEFTRAALHAASVLDAMGVGDPLKLGGENGKFDDGYEWEAQIKEYEVPPDVNATVTGVRPETGMRLYQIDLRMIWGKPPQQREAKFHTLRAIRPENLDG